MQVPDPACHDLHRTKSDFLDHQHQNSTVDDQAPALQQLMAQPQAEDILIEEAVEIDDEDEDEGELDEEIGEEVLEAIEEEEEEIDDDDDDDDDGSGRDMIMDEVSENTRENADDISPASGLINSDKKSATAIDDREVQDEAPVEQLNAESPNSGSSSSSSAVICPIAMRTGIIEQAAANSTNGAATYANPNKGSEIISSPYHREGMRNPNPRELSAIDNQREATLDSPNNNQRLATENPNPNPSPANDHPPKKKKNETAQKEKENLVPPNCTNSSDYNRIRKVAGHICLPIPGSKGKIRKSLKQMNTIIKPINLDFGSAAARLKQQQQQQNVINNGDLQINKQEINGITTNGDMNGNSRRRISAVNGSSKNHGQNPPSTRISTNEDDQRPHSYTPSSHITINGGRASTESSPSYIRHRGSVSSDDLRKFSTLHIRSRSSTRSERSSLRGGKIDRVARFAELQKIWRNDSFVRGIDGEKRPQILQHLFAPLRGNN